MPRKIFLYFALPFGVTLALIAMYFSGIDLLQQIVSPRMPRMNPNSGREFGVLENAQNVVIMAMILIAILGYRRKDTRLEKAAMAAIGVFAAFILLEEIDYGLHFYEYFMNIPWQESARARNLHNVGRRTQVAKQIVDAGMVALFVIAPLALANSRRPLLRYLAPDRYSILTLIAMVLLHAIAHELKARGAGSPGSMHKNLSEFRELVTYYVFMLYLFEVALRRTLAPARPGGQGKQAASE